MKCPICLTDLGTQETITAIEGKLLCNECALKAYSEQEIIDLGEEIVPVDIGIAPGETYTCGTCKKSFTAVQWNVSTLMLCTNRNERRKYVPIEKSVKEHWYKCPGCGNRHSVKGAK